MLWKINQDIFDLTKQYSTQLDNFAIQFDRKGRHHISGISPMFYDEHDFQDTSNLLIIGLNPSLSDAEYRQQNGDSIFSWKSLSSLKMVDLCYSVSKIADFQQNQIYSDKAHPYFKVIQKHISQLIVPKKIVHYDLYSFRATNSKICLGFKDDPVLIDYHKQSVKRLTSMLETGFKTILILNKKVSELLRDELNLSKNSNCTLKIRKSLYGVYNVKSLPETEKIPYTSFIFFKQLSSGANFSNIEIEKLKENLKEHFIS
ncbi:hypothetical protein [Pollutibacter soli]|uniref:hypothetical protein n=1 Tax=Pollutibacter soli TaxID=3034157 RepID=UPI003013B146